MNTTLLDRLVRFSAYSNRPDDHTTGQGYIRCAYASRDAARVPNVVVEVTRIDTGAAVKVGDLLTLNMMEVSTNLNPEARGTLIDDACPQLSIRATAGLRLRGGE